MGKIISCKVLIHYFRYEGVLSVTELKKAMRDAHVNRPANRLLHDLRRSDISHFNHNQIRDLGLHAEELVKDTKRGEYKSAIVVADKLTYGLVRCAVSHSHDIVERSARIYYDIDFAIDWLVGLRT